MIETFAILATLAAGFGWFLYLNKARAAKKWREETVYEREYTRELRKLLRDADDTSNRQADTIGGLQSRLQEIADMETASANATVKRMAKVARREA